MCKYADNTLFSSEGQSPLVFRTSQHVIKLLYELFRLICFALIHWYVCVRTEPFVCQDRQQTTFWPVNWSMCMKDLNIFARNTKFKLIHSKSSVIWFRNNTIMIAIASQCYQHEKTNKWIGGKNDMRNFCGIQEDKVVILVTRIPSRPPLSQLNPLRAKFYRGNLNIYLHFVSFLHIDATQGVDILPQIRQDSTYST